MTHKRPDESTEPTIDDIIKIIDESEAENDEY